MRTVSSLPCERTILVRTSLSDGCILTYIRVRARTGMREFSALACNFSKPNENILYDEFVMLFYELCESSHDLVSMTIFARFHATSVAWTRRGALIDAGVLVLAKRKSSLKNLSSHYYLEPSKTVEDC
ncbi:hypothetical protein V1522DRAFT_414364 [Lipomyces starkeyi]